jgi:excinuclease ABC subunit A
VLATRSAPDENAHLASGQERFVVEGQRGPGRFASGWALLGCGVHRRSVEGGCRSALGLLPPDTSRRMHRIHLQGARTHNLVGVSLDLLEGQLTAVTGVSGSGKSSLAVDTLYAEGQRRFVESFSPYARQFLERLERPPIDRLEPVAAGIAVDRRTSVKSSRSTVATLADLEAYLSALFSREALPICPEHGLEAVLRDPTSAAQALLATHAGATAVLTYPVRVPDTETFLDVRATLLRDGYRRVLVAGQVRLLEELRPAEVIGAAGSGDVVVDRLVLSADRFARLAESLEQAWARGQGEAQLWLEGERLRVRQGLVCPSCARTFEPPRPSLFSYQSPVGACPACRGFGRTLGIDWTKVIPDEGLSIRDGALRPWNGRSSEWERSMLARFAKQSRIPLDVPWRELGSEQREAILEGEGGYRQGHYPGLRAWFRWMESRTYKMHVRVLLSRYRAYTLCTACAGARLNPDALRYRVGGLDLAAWHRLEVSEAHRRLEGLKTRTGQGELARRELLGRLGWLAGVGLGYLGLDRQSRTLSGGEAQRVSLTAALGTGLTGALFVLDEPSVGLHFTDLPPLTSALTELAARGNAVLVLEHDPAIIRAAARVLELGPGAGPAGGRLCFDGSPAALAARADTATGRVLAGRHAVARVRRTPEHWIDIAGASANNLCDVDLRLPLGVLGAVCGPSGSGKSTLVEEVLYRTLAPQLGMRDMEAPGPVRSVSPGLPLRRVVLVDQSPLGRTSRGNAATYTRTWDVFRKRFAAEPDAVLREFGPSHFSFNVGKGRCEACSGEGSETVEMQFLADVALTCPSCRGRRFKESVLEVQFRGHSVAEVLGMTVDQALKQYGDDSAIADALAPLQRLGLGYLPLGQPLSTLSGGEAQRVKLARALGGDQRGVLYLLDEPSAGLHGEDVARVLEALHTLVEAGASVLAVDHDLDLLRSSDWLVELGPAGGRNGGRVVAVGTPEQLAHAPTRTGEALRAAHSKVALTEPAPTPPADHFLEVEHAREHNLKDVSCRLPLQKLIVLTGPSGSGKSTLAFDVIFAEAQRRFTETLSPYARAFLPTLPRPDVERIRGLPPSVALEQRTARAGATSTVATVTEVAHYLRLLFAKLGMPHCPRDGTAIAPRSADALYGEARGMRGDLELLAPVVRARKGTYLDVFTAAARAGVQQAVCDGERVSTDAPPKLVRSREHTIDLVSWAGPAGELPREAFDRALRWGQGTVKVRRGARELLLSAERSCPRCGTAIPELDPRWFSFNTAQGRCPDCEGTGQLGGLSESAGTEEPCPSCEGTRLQPIPRGVRLFGRRYAEVVQQSVTRALAEVRGWKLSGDAERIGGAALGELVRRLEFLERVGLGYLSLDRGASTLSGGEMQRLRLSAQAGAGLTGALYVLDEPTIGLHPRDTGRLLENLRTLVDTGSTVLVVEHDLDTLRAADHLVDLGPGGGRLGGRIVAAGPPGLVLASESSPTAQALRQPVTGLRPVRPLPEGWLRLEGARCHNLRGVDLIVPLARMTVVAGVSGSGKSTLVRRVLFPAVREALGRTTPAPGPFRRLSGLGPLRRVLAVDQSPIGRTPRSVPATFLGLWDELRRALASTPEARRRGFGPARFSFNTAAGGRCPVCQGQGSISHEMSFLPDVTTPCEACGGARFEPATLEIRWHGFNAGEALRLTVDEAAEAFAALPRVAGPLRCLSELGVGYLQLGQGSHTLSGGEAQRLKLAAELTATARHEPTLYVLDEPTTGLHLADVAKLLRVLDQLVARGDTLVVIEHHPVVIAAADHVVELGPEGGEGGGRIVSQGSPAVIARADTATGRVLAELLGPAQPRRAASR